MSKLSSICREKYVGPILSSDIAFTKLIRDSSAISAIFKSMINEYNTREFGHEFSIKSDIMKLFALLIRNYRINRDNFIKANGLSTELNHVRKIANYISEE